MKKLMVILVLGIFLTSFISAISITSLATENQEQTQQNNQADETQVQKTIQSQKKLQKHLMDRTCPNNCTCVGSTIKCQTQERKEMTIHAGNSGNTIFQVKEANASTKVQLYKSDDGNIVGMFKNKNSSIVLPDQIQERIQKRLQQENCSCDMELDEDGIYQVQTQKQSRLFGLFPVREKVKLQYNAETGELIRERRSWWGFLAKDVEEEDSEQEQTDE